MKLLFCDHFCCYIQLLVFTCVTFSERSDSRSNTPPRRRSRSRSVDRAAEQLGRLHICNFDESLRKDDLKDAFGYAIFFS